MRPSTLPQGPDVSVLEHTMYCFVVDTNVLRFSVSIIILVVIDDDDDNDDDDDDDTVSPSEFALFQLPLLLFFLLFFTGEKCIAIFSLLAQT